MNNTNRAAAQMNEALRLSAIAGARSAMANAETVRSAYPALRMAKKSAALRNRICDDLRNAR